jgi:hypothetical protein
VSMNHNAFVFDCASFEAELRPLLIETLATNESLRLVAWIEANRLSLVDPYEGKKLVPNWEMELSKPDVHLYGDIALTKYYDPTDSIGLDDSWQDVGETLKAHGLREEIILGTPVGMKDRLFDPGGMGSYFQSQETVVANQRNLEVALRNSGQGVSGCDLQTDAWRCS